MLSALLKNVNMKKKELAEKLGLSRVTVSRWGEEAPRYAVVYLELLAEVRKSDAANMALEVPAGKRCDGCMFLDVNFKNSAICNLFHKNQKFRLERGEINIKSIEKLPACPVVNTNQKIVTTVKSLKDEDDGVALGGDESEPKLN